MTVWCSDPDMDIWYVRTVTMTLEIQDVNRQTDTDRAIPIYSPNNPIYIVQSINKFILLEHVSDQHCVHCRLFQ